MRGSKIAVRMAGLPFEKPRIRVPSRPLPAGTQHWPIVLSSKDADPFLPRLLWTEEGFQGVILLDPTPLWFIRTPKDDPSTKVH
jgi:hypothetical protein